jgi:hypothetical protein
VIHDRMTAAVPAAATKANCVLFTITSKRKPRTAGRAEGELRYVEVAVPLNRRLAYLA